MSLIALFSDLHVHKWREFAKLNKQGVNDRLLDCVSVLTDIDAYCQRHMIEHILCLGDLFHKRAILDVETFNLVFKTIAKSKSQWWLMSGNHDQATKDGRIHSLEPFAELENVHVVDNYTAIVEDVLVDFFPYNDNEKQVMQDLKDRQTGQNHKVAGLAGMIACMHHGFKGARVGSSLEYEVKEPLDPQEVVKMGYQYIFSGHYHHSQYLAPNLMYLGAPLEHTRHDKSSGDRGFKVYNTETKEVRAVPLKRPRFITLTEAEYMQMDPQNKGLVVGNFIDFVTSAEDPSALVEMLKEDGARSVEVKPPTNQVVKKNVKRLDVDPSTDPKEVIKSYVKWSQKHGKTKSLDLKRLTQVGIDLIKEAQQ